MQEAVSTVEREGDHLFRPGQSGNPNGRPKGVPNKVSKSIREAVLDAVQPGMCHPEGLRGWLVDRAQGGIEDRKIFAAVVSRVIPVEITGEGGGPVKIDLGWLTGRKIGGDIIDITPTTQTLADQAPARLPTDIQSEHLPSAAEVPVVKVPRARASKVKP
ncbi:hypothetical protein UFOVP381_21 [uncultured Caudovirales phage]|uniref:DUF5681 domain-containing protein n=1 Tax=uncultured Caudovirales phage TaxID=2100421 RepID=A0A6J7WZ37_9CAUD|nr:hypothetical protein UFOVP381_21 [uncultured Caudovirales phage]